MGSASIIGAAPLEAQLAAQQDRLTDTWRWAHFTTSSGLPSSRVHRIREGPDGTFWAGTAAGLAWYDGFVWTPVGPELGLPGRRPSDLAIDEDGRVWLVIDQALYVGGRAGFDPVAVEVGDTAQAVLGVAPLDPDTVLVLTPAGLFNYQHGRVVPFPTPPTAVDRVFGLEQSDEGTAFVATYSGVYELAGGRWFRRLSIGGRFFQLLTVASTDSGANGVVVTTGAQQDAGFWGWRGAGVAERLEELGTNTVADVAGGPDGVLVAFRSGEAGIWRDGALAMLEDPPDQLRGVFELRYAANGDLWVGTGRGLFVHRRSSMLWTYWQHPGPSDWNAVHEILLARDGSVWLATGAGVEVVGPDGVTRQIDRIGETPLQDVTGLAEDGAGNIWISSGSGFGGAYRWDGETWRRYGAESGLLAPRVHRIRRDRQGRLWFLGMNPSSTRLRGEGAEPGAFVLEDGRFTQWGTDRGLLSGRVYAFVEGPDAALWFGTLDGLSRRKDGEWTHWTVGDGLLGPRVFAIEIGADGRLWFSDSENGVGFIDAQDRVRYPETAPYVGRHVWDLRLGPDGGLWVAFDGGVARYEDGTWAPFHGETGLGSTRPWPVLPTRDRVYVGTRGSGVSILNLDEARRPTPRVLLETPVVEGNRVHVRWAAFGFNGRPEPDAVETRYRLDDGPWSTWSTARSHTLLDLAPGGHELTVQTKGLLGQLGEPVHTTFSVAPPLFLRPVFLGPVGALLLLTLMLTTILVLRRRRSELALRRSEARYRHLFENATYGLFRCDDEGRLLAANPALLAMLGHGSDTDRGALRLDEVFAEPREWARLVGELERSGEPSEDEVDWVRDDGKRIRVKLSGRRIQGEPGGGDAFEMIAEDVTEQRSLEEQLRNAQKMEAIGQLAGGVAHDFNNMLTVILGETESALAAGDAGAETRAALLAIRAAAERSSDVTRRLLAFSRRQIVEPTVFMLDQLVEDSEPMIRRLIEENIRLSTRTAADLWPVKADRSQIEHVLVNLVVNARDAMPDGGTLSIETDNAVLDARFCEAHPGARPGRYVSLRVRDTGHGMSEDTRSHLFEPFFTTKDPGKGTGLGLPMCYGITKQHDGYIDVDSAPGAGTTMTVYLPRALEDVPARDRPVSEDRPTGAETILIVEDETPVRRVARRMLERQGYTVLEASDAEEGLEIVEAEVSHVDMLLTDVILPGMSGRELADRVREKRPEMPILFVSGYTDDVTLKKKLLEHGATLLPKPFSVDALSRTVRAVLDGSDE